MSKYDLTQDQLKDVLEYSPETGKFTWRVRRGPCAAGRMAGTRDWTGYVCVNINGQAYRAHRLAWLYVYGEFPPVDMDMDHINRVRDDNRISNLRIATRSQNMHNRRAQGYYYKEQTGRWYAHVRNNKVLKHLGVFDTEQEASDAYQRAKRTIAEEGHH